MIQCFSHSILSFSVTSPFPTFYCECLCHHQPSISSCQIQLSFFGTHLLELSEALDKVDHFLLIKIPTSRTTNCCDFLSSLVVPPNVGVLQGSFPGSLYTYSQGGLIQLLVINTIDLYRTPKFSSDLTFSLSVRLVYPFA